MNVSLYLLIICSYIIRTTPRGHHKEHILSIGKARSFPGRSLAFLDNAQFVITDRLVMPLGFRPATVKDAHRYPHNLERVLRSMRIHDYEVKSEYLYVKGFALPVLIRKDTEVCRPELSRCSHTCMVKDDGTHQCTCPDKFYLSDDMRTCQDVCNLLPVSGKCGTGVISWYYDKPTLTCKQFLYRGCGVKGNHFATEEECCKTCCSPPLMQHPVMLPAVPATPLPPPIIPIIIRAPPAPSPRPTRSTPTRTTRPWPLHSTANPTKSTTPSPVTSDPEPLIHNCESSPDIGGCSEKNGGKMIVMWYWDGPSDSCKKFGYSGCGGNGNRYKTEAACKKWCEQAVAEQPPTKSRTKASTKSRTKASTKSRTKASTKSQTKAPTKKKEGSRTPLFEHFLNDQVKSAEKKVDTQQFLSNPGTEDILARDEIKNKDVTTPEAQVAMIPEVNLTKLLHWPRPSDEDGACRDVPNAGYGNDESRRWYYDSGKKKCRPFTYNGKGGNNNRYRTKDDCYDNCDPCNAAPDIGQVTSQSVMWFYDTATKRCHSFIYGGYGGNKNRFKSKDECELLCDRSQSKEARAPPIQASPTQTLSDATTWAPEGGSTTMFPRGEGRSTTMPSPPPSAPARSPAPSGPPGPPAERTGSTKTPKPTKWPHRPPSKSAPPPSPPGPPQTSMPSPQPSKSATKSLSPTTSPDVKTTEPKVADSKTNKPTPLVNCPPWGKDFQIKLVVLNEGKFVPEMASCKSPTFQALRTKLVHCISQIYIDDKTYKDANLISINRDDEGILLNFSVRFLEEGGNRLQKIVDKVRVGKLCTFIVKKEFEMCKELSGSSSSSCGDLPIINIFIDGVQCPIECLHRCHSHCPYQCCHQNALPPAACDPGCQTICTPSCPPQCCSTHSQSCYPSCPVSSTNGDQNNNCDVICQIRCTDSCPPSCCTAPVPVINVITPRCQPQCKEYCAPTCAPMCCIKGATYLCNPVCERHCLPSCPPECCSDSDSEIQPIPKGHMVIYDTKLDKPSVKCNQDCLEYCDPVMCPAHCCLSHILQHCTENECGTYCGPTCARQCCSRHHTHHRGIRAVPPNFKWHRVYNVAKKEINESN